MSALTSLRTSERAWPDPATPGQVSPDPASPDRISPDRILQRLEWQVIRRLDGLLQGDYRSLFYGYGVDFADLREYQPGDDIRYIDWNVTARMNTPYIRQYIEDREITAWFLLDLSPSMDFGIQQNLKRIALIDFVATLARLLTRHGNRAGAMLYGGGAKPQIERVIPARSSRVQVLHLINELLKQPLLTPISVTDLAPLIKGGLSGIKKRSLVFIVSDFISVPGWERPLTLLSQRHEVIAVRVWDPREVELPEMGLVVLEDAETGEQLLVDTSDKNFRSRFKQAAQQREINLNETFKHAGIDMLSLSTEEDLIRAIVRFAMLRSQRRK